MISSRKPIFEFALDQKLIGHDLTSYPGRLSAATAAVTVLTRITDLGAREEYVRTLSGKVQLGADEINRLLSAELTKQRAQSVTNMRRSEFEPQEPKFEDELPEFPIPNPNDPNTRFEQEVLAVLLQLPKAWNVEQVKLVCSELFATAAYVVIAQAALKSVDALAEVFWFNRIATKTPDVLHPLLRSLGSKAMPVSSPEEAESYAHGVIQMASKKILVRNRDALRSALAMLNHETHSAEHLKVQQDLVALEAKIRELS
jgi:DNA primase